MNTVLKRTTDRRIASLFLRMFVCAGPVLTASAQAGPWTLSRVSLGPNGAEISVGGWEQAISPSGRLVAFFTMADLLPQDGNGTADIYILDTTTGLLELLSATTNGTSGIQPTFLQPDFSYDDRMVSFMTRADVVPGLADTYHAFVRDRWLGQTTLVSVSSSGIEGSCSGYCRISGDGRIAVFPTLETQLFPLDNNNAADIFTHDLVTGTTELISVSTSGTTGNGASGDFDGADISYDGRFVVFGSLASNLVPGYTPAFGDVYMRDRVLGTTSVISVGMAGQPSNWGSGYPRCSEDGQIVAFEGWGSNLVPGDTNGVGDIFVRDLINGTTTRVSVSSSGVEANDRSTGTALSGDGRFVAFSSLATNLVPGDTNGKWDAFVYDRFTSQLQRVSVAGNGVQASGDSHHPSLSRNAFDVVFQSDAPNLVPNDNNNTMDAFLLRGHHRQPTGYCTGMLNSQGCAPTISSLGIPTTSLPQGFLLTAQQVLNQKAGLLIYSTAGPAAAPFGGGTLCLLAPVRRTPGLNSGGSTSGVDCTGTFSFDFNAWIATGSDPALIAGAGVWAQYWSRDPGFAPPYNSNLTDARAFVLAP